MNIVHKDGNVAFNEMACKWYNDSKPYFDMRLYLSNRPHPYIDDKEREIIDEGINRYEFLKNKFDYISEFNLPINNTITYMSYMTYLYISMPIHITPSVIYVIFENYIKLGNYITRVKHDSGMLIPLMYLITYSDFTISSKDCIMLREMIDDGLDGQSLNVYVNALKIIKDCYYTIMPRLVFDKKDGFPSSYVWFMNEIHKLNKKRSMSGRKLSTSEGDIINDILGLIKTRK